MRRSRITRESVLVMSGVVWLGTMLLLAYAPPETARGLQAMQDVRTAAGLLFILDLIGLIVL